MSNRTTDLAKMRSSVDAGNRRGIFDGKKNARLGTEKNPAVVTVQTDNRFKEVRAAFAEKGWSYRINLEPDKPEDVADLTRLLNPPKPAIAKKKLDVMSHVPAAAGRNINFAVVSRELVDWNIRVRSLFI